MCHRQYIKRKVLEPCVFTELLFRACFYSVKSNFWLSNEADSHGFVVMGSGVWHENRTKQESRAELRTIELSNRSFNSSTDFLAATQSSSTRNKNERIELLSVAKQRRLIFSLFAFVESQRPHTYSWLSCCYLYPYDGLICEVILFVSDSLSHDDVIEDNSLWVMLVKSSQFNEFHISWSSKVLPFFYEMKWSESRAMTEIIIESN